MKPMQTSHPKNARAGATEVIGFLKENPYRGFAYILSQNNRRPKFLMNRILAVYGFLKGYLSVKESMMLLLPAGLKSEALRRKYSEFVSEEITASAKKHIKDHINDDGSVRLYEHRFYPAHGNLGESMELFSQVFIKDQYRAIEHIKDGSVIIDAGANIGSFSVYSSNIAKNTKVYAFEPVKETFEVLKKNASPYANISCNNLGLGDSIEKKKIYFNKDATVGSTFEDDEIAGSHGPSDLSQEAGITTIDHFVRQNDIQRVDFIKMDTEGYERQILEGARETIRRFHPVMAMSAYHKCDDKTVLPAIVDSISPDYDHMLVRIDEEDLVFFPKKA